jgi:hypothetical protein
VNAIHTAAKDVRNRWEGDVDGWMVGSSRSVLMGFPLFEDKTTVSVTENARTGVAT